MAYLVDRQRVLRADEIVALVRVPRRGARSRLVLTDNSLYQTRTRPHTLSRYLATAFEPMNLLGTRAGRTRGAGGQAKGVTWRKPA